MQSMEDNKNRLFYRRLKGTFSHKRNKSGREVNTAREPSRTTDRPPTFHAAHGGDVSSSYVGPRGNLAVPTTTLSVFVKTSSLPSLRSTSRGTFDHVKEPANGDGGGGGGESSRRASTFRRRALLLVDGPGCAQYASSVAAASGKVRAPASSETHVALCIRPSIRGHQHASAR